MIDRIDGNFNLSLSESSKVPASTDNSSFYELLQDNLNQVNELHKNADQLTEDFALGKTDNIHEVTIAAEKAQMALNLTSAIQNKVIQSYEEIMRMQV